jgi:hypothetical protein
VRDEKFGSSRVHWRRVPAGTINSFVCAVAIVVMHTTKVINMEVLRIFASASVAINERARKRAEGTLGAESALNNEVGNCDWGADRNAEPSEAWHYPRE